MWNIILERIAGFFTSFLKCTEFIESPACQDLSACGVEAVSCDMEKQASITQNIMTRGYVVSITWLLYMSVYDCHRNYLIIQLWRTPLEEMKGFCAIHCFYVSTFNSTVKENAKDYLRDLLIWF